LDLVGLAGANATHRTIAANPEIWEAGASAADAMATNASHASQRSQRSRCQPVPA
tara:strand:- start:1591 stop:1755 length:165 start_codon:yes stop_codon:yes gene_type:complete